MGGKEIEFEVERRREDRTPVGKDEGKRTSKGKETAADEGKNEEPAADDGSWQAYFENDKTVENMKFFVMAQSFVMFLTFGLPQMQKVFAALQETFFNPGRMFHAAVVLLAVGGYSVVLFRGLNSQLSRYMYSVLEMEVEKNPHMKKDLEEYRAQLEEQERQKDQMKELETQARRIQEQLQELSKKQSSLRSRKYIKVEGVDDGGDEGGLKETSINQSKEQLERSEL